MWEHWLLVGTINWEIFPVDDSPNYPDHDFPYRNAKLIPSGYMLLQQSARFLTNRIHSRSLSPVRQHEGTCRSRRSRSVSPRKHESADHDGIFYRDKLGRLDYHVPNTGPLYMVNRASRFHGSNSSAHVSDLASLLPVIRRRGRSILSCIVDGGPDQSPKHLVNVLSYGRLWRDGNLYALFVTTHAPGYSAYNKVEHAWSFLSRCLTSVTFPMHLPGERPPAEQSLSEDETVRKESVVFDQALNQLDGY